MIDGPIYVFRAPPSVSAATQRTWVARVHGISTRYGLDREFVRALNDFSAAKRGSVSGKMRGVVSTFPLRAGWVVEVSHPGRRGPVRYFARVTADGLDRMTAEEVTRWAAAQTP